MDLQFKSTLIHLISIDKKDILSLVAGFFCVVVGITVLIGWYAHIPRLIQIQPGTTPMHYNTALCFTIVGIGILTLRSSYKKLSLFIASILIIITGLTFLEYTFNINLGIDQFFFETHLVYSTSPIGRMSPNSALSFLMCRIAIVLLSLGTSRFLYCLQQLPLRISKNI